MADDRRPSCESTRARLLEVDLDRISGADGALAAHLAACPSCRRADERLRVEVAALEAALSGRSEARGLGDARAIALAESGIRRAGPAPGSGAGDLAAGRFGGVPFRPSRTASRRVVAVRVAAAAAVLGLATIPLWRLLPREAPPTGTAATLVGTSGAGAPRPGIPAAEPESAVFSVDVPSTGGVAVFATRNPKIRVVWFYETNGTSGDGQ